MASYGYKPKFDVGDIKIPSYLTEFADINVLGAYDDMQKRQADDILLEQRKEADDANDAIQEVVKSGVTGDDLDTAIERVLTEHGQIDTLQKIRNQKLEREADTRKAQADAMIKLSAIEDPSFRKQLAELYGTPEVPYAGKKKDGATGSDLKNTRIVGGSLIQIQPDGSVKELYTAPDKKKGSSDPVYNPETGQYELPVDATNESVGTDPFNITEKISKEEIARMRSERNKAPARPRADTPSIEEEAIKKQREIEGKKTAMPKTYQGKPVVQNARGEYGFWKIKEDGTRVFQVLNVK